MAFKRSSVLFGISLDCGLKTVVRKSLSHVRHQFDPRIETGGNMRKFYFSWLLATIALFSLATGALAQNFNIPKGDLKTVLDAYREQTGVSLVVMTDAVKGVRSQGVS